VKGWAKNGREGGKEFLDGLGGGSSWTYDEAKKTGKKEMVLCLPEERRLDKLGTVAAQAARLC
jgi:hypothetical protein